MVGPVFALELLRGRRRSRLDLFRRVYAGWLILQFGVVFLSYLAEILGGFVSPRVGISRFLNSFLEAFLAQHFLLLLLLTPTFAAGAISDEKAQGTLQDLLTADLTSWEIIGGKLCGRLAQVLLLALVGLPLLGLLGGYGHLHLLTFLSLSALTVALAFALGAASILASVWSKQTRAAVLLVYTGGGLGFLSVRLLEWGLSEGIPRLASDSLLRGVLERLDGFLHYLSLFYVLEPVWDRNDPGEQIRRLLAGALVWGTFGAGCMALAVWRLRPAYGRQLEGAGRRNRTVTKTRRPMMDDEPIRWKEREVRGADLWSWLPRLPQRVTVPMVLLGTMGLSVSFLAQGYSEGEFLAQGVLVLLLTSLVAGVRASGTVCAERERQTWEGLLLSPLDTKEIVHDKLLGIMDSVRLPLCAYALPALLVSSLAGVNAFEITFLLLLLTWVAAYYLGATGIWCSVRSQSSWRSLLATLASGYGFGLGYVFLSWLTYFCVACVAFPFGLFLAEAGTSEGVLRLLLFLFDLTMSLLLAWLLWKAAELKLHLATNWVDDHEREGRPSTRARTRAMRKSVEFLEGQRDKI
jgi:ABC-type transport system involved in multi-copper enzyme maturation permease subunit